MVVLVTVFPIERIAQFGSAFGDLFGRPADRLVDSVDVTAVMV